MDNINLCPSHKVLSYDYVFPSRTNKQHMLISDLNLWYYSLPTCRCEMFFQFFIILREWIYLLSSSIHKSCQKQVNYTKLIWFVSSPSPRWFLYRYFFYRHRNPSSRPIVHIISEQTKMSTCPLIIKTNSKHKHKRVI